MIFPIDTTITLSLLFSVLSVAFVWWRTRNGAVDARFKVGSDRMDRHELRLQAIEQTVHQLPDRQDLHKLEMSMERMNGTMGRMEAVLEGNQNIMERLETIVSRHEDHLLQGTKR